MNKLITRSIYIIINIVIIFGFLLPYLISAKNNELVIIGIGIILLNIYHLITFFIKTIKIK